MIPYGKQSISEEDIEAVVRILRSDFLTQGPAVPAFEQAVSEYCGARFAVAVNSATSALHIAYLSLNLGPGDELWTSPITFVATANAALYCGAKVRFLDVEPDSGNLSVENLGIRLRENRSRGLSLPKIVVPVHLGGLSCDMERVHALSLEYGFSVVEDASHAIGGRYQSTPVGSCRFSNITIFSFHPVKVMTTGEGGMAVTNDLTLAKRMNLLRSHGITRDPAEMTTSPEGGWYYQQIALGFNYRMTDMQAALGLSQLERIDEFVGRRNYLADRYDRLLANLPVGLPARRDDTLSAFHLYAIRIDEKTGKDRRYVFEALRDLGIGVQVHYIPVYMQPYYYELSEAAGELPEAGQYYKATISLPLFHSLSEDMQDRVIAALTGVLK